MSDLSLTLHPQLVKDLHKVFPEKLPTDLKGLSVEKVAYAMGQQSVLKYLDEVVEMQKNEQTDTDLQIF